MSDVFLSRDDWQGLLKAVASARRGMRPYLSADQATKLVARGYLAASPRDPTSYVVTASGRQAAANYERSLR
ncbi:MAG: hypothetical protein JSR73_09040 [Proteobacteria bacterium]|nr:hypothetical protein [Pseudomonadota bacterium]